MTTTFETKKQEHQQDKKYLTVIFGGAMLFSLATVGLGQMIAVFGSGAVGVIGSAITLMGLAWVATTLFLGTSIYKRIEAAHPPKQGKHVMVKSLQTATS